MKDDIKLTRHEQFKVLKRLLGYVLPYRKLILFATFCLALATVFDLLGPMVIKVVLDDYIQVQNFNFTHIIGWMTLYVFLSALVSLFRYLYILRFFETGNRITQKLRLELFSKLQSMGMRYFDQTPAGSIVSRVTNDTDSIQEMLVSVISVAFSSIFMLVFILSAMAMLDWKLTLICMAFIPVILFIVSIYQRLSTKYYQIARNKLSELNTRLAESISGMGIIQIFNQQKRLSETFRQTNQEYYLARMHNLRLDGLLLYPIIHLFTALTLAAVLSYAGIQSFSNLITIGYISVFVDYIYKMFEPLFQIMDRLSIFQQALVSSSRIFTILDHSEMTPQQNNVTDHQISEARIEFKHVSFSYDGEQDVLKDISFTIEPGQTLALVGHTGSGKSSIINVIMRFYEFTRGEVLIDGQSLKQYPLEHLRKNMSLVLQEPFMYYGTVTDNIRLLNDEITKEEVVKACKFVQADSFIQALPDGYEQLVAERGASFSSGQKQLLAFARAMVTDPKILILDEATANIDTETESLIQEGLSRMRQGRTTIAIAHRLSTIKDADQILVLDKGRIIEQGTHDELLALKGSYYTMYQLQIQNMA